MKVINFSVRLIRFFTHFIKVSEIKLENVDRFSENLKSVPESYLDCVKWARLNFEESFSKQEDFSSDKNPAGEYKKVK